MNEAVGALSTRNSTPGDRREVRVVENKGAPICPYCGNESKLASGRDVYPGRPDLYAKLFYLCRQCNAYVGCHPKTAKPMGGLADAKLRQARQDAHFVFDALWESGGMSRTSAYQALSAALGIPSEECHIGMFDLMMCGKAIAAAKAMKNEIAK